MMRKTIVAGNWKMNLRFEEAMALLKEIDAGAQDHEHLERLIVFPPYPYLGAGMDLIGTSKIHFGAQNISSEERGAYTGEVSAEMLSSMQVEYCLIGHSERRSIFDEDHAMLRQKVDRAMENELKVIFCCGEQLSERDAGKQNDVVSAQLHDSLFHLKELPEDEVIIAYEPVWAIGTGRTASAEQAGEMHAHIRQLVAERYGQETANRIHILYGGSCKPDNAKSLFGMPDVDGGLIGGASLKGSDFLQIAAALNG